MRSITRCKILATYQRKERAICNVGGSGKLWESLVRKNKLTSAELTCSTRPTEHLRTSRAKAMRLRRRTNARTTKAAKTKKTMPKIQLPVEAIDVTTCINANATNAITH